MKRVATEGYVQSKLTGDDTNKGIIRGLVGGVVGGMAGMLTIGEKAKLVISGTASIVTGNLAVGAKSSGIDILGGIAGAYIGGGFEKIGGGIENANSIVKGMVGWTESVFNISLGTSLGLIQQN